MVLSASLAKQSLDWPEISHSSSVITFNKGGNIFTDCTLERLSLQSYYRYGVELTNQGLDEIFWLTECRIFLPAGRNPRLKSAISLFVLLMVMWLLSSGHYTPLIISFGVISCAGVVALCWRMRIVDDEGIPVHLLVRAIRYIPWIFYQVFMSNIDVARRVLLPRGEISPLLFEVKTSQKTDLGKVLYANSITLTPGTVSILVWHDRILVHGIAKQVADDLLEGEMDRQVTRLEGAAS